MMPTHLVQFNFISIALSAVDIITKQLHMNMDLNIDPEWAMEPILIW